MPRTAPTLRCLVMASALALCCTDAGAAPADGPPEDRDGGGASIEHEADVVSGSRSPMDVAGVSGQGGNLILNGGFSQLPNPLVNWSNAASALATWVSEGANGSQGAVQLRFLAAAGAQARPKGAVFHTGLIQCVRIPGPGSYALGGYARIAENAAQSSLARIRWTLRANGPQCSGPIAGSGAAEFPRSTNWVASTPTAILVEPPDWTAATTVALELQVGDSSTTTIEPLEAYLDQVYVTEGALFEDGFE